MTPFTHCSPVEPVQPPGVHTNRAQIQDPSTHDASPVCW
jgi:hypothetical protein